MTSIHVKGMFWYVHTHMHVYVCGCVYVNYGLEAWCICTCVYVCVQACGVHAYVGICWVCAYINACIGVGRLHIWGIC